jgi:5,10-methenyltetrahydrofolate synthetase
MSDPALKDVKRKVREQAIAQRDALDPQTRCRLSAAITARLLALPGYLQADTLAAYASIGSEFDTGDFIADVLRRGKCLLLPRIDRSRRAIDLWQVTDPAHDLIAGTWGIREPDPARCKRIEPVDVPFVLVPGVAFTRQGGRLGYGGGYYDGLLSRLDAAALKVAAAFPQQILDSLPTGPRDIPVDLVVTDAAIYDASNRSGSAAAHT